MIKKIVESLDQRPNITNSIVKSLVYTITLITLFSLSALLINTFIIKIKRTVYMKYISENYIWLGITLFVMILSLKLFEVFRNRHKETTKSSTTNKCLTLICYFISCNRAFIAAGFFIGVYYKLNFSFLLFYLAFFIFGIWSSYILMNCFKRVVKSNKAFDVFAAVITSSLDTLLFTATAYLFMFTSSFLYILSRHIVDNLPWYMIAFFMARLTWKIYKIYKQKADS